VTSVRGCLKCYDIPHIKEYWGYSKWYLCGENGVDKKEGEVFRERERE
jgi:hypothetical protein